MQNCCCSLARFFGNFDIFRLPMNFVFNKNEKISTVTGKILTLGLFSFILYSFLVSDLINKSNPQTLSQDILCTRRPEMAFSKENMTLVLGVADEVNNFYNDESIFFFNFYSISWNPTTKVSEETQGKLNLCKAEDFKEDSEEFHRLSLNGTYCLPDSPLKVGGYWDEPSIDYFYAQIVLCQNSSDSEIICKSEEEINEFFKNKFLDIYITTHNIDASNYHEPISRNLKIYYQTLDINLSKIMNLFIKDATIKTDDGFYLQNSRQDKTFLQGEINFDVFLNDISNNGVIYEVNIYSSNEQTIVTRNYQKIQTLLAQWGGICNLLFFLGLIFCRIEGHYRFISDISHELYKIPQEAPKPVIMPKPQLKDDQKRKSIKKSMKITSQPEIRYLNSQPEREVLTANKISENRDQIEMPKILTTNTEAQLTPNSNVVEPVTFFEDIILKEKKENFEEINLQNSRKMSEGVLEEEILENRRYKASKGDMGKNSRREEKVTHSITAMDYQEISRGIVTSLSLRKSDENICTSSATAALIKEKEKRKISLQIPTVSRFASEKSNAFSNEINKDTEKEKRFSLGFWNYLKLLIKNRKCCLNRKERLFVKIENQIFETLDVLRLMRKVQEIEKLKKILLNEEQLYFFNTVQKQKIPMPENSRMSQMQNSILKKTGNCKALIEVVRERQKEYLRKENISDLDQRLMKLVEENLVII